ncbi:hypothetical protein DFQ30_004024 [Apophysomyces sp. BC1015]|nr:hypothetical protein DFQ30_004024 [Apophysomyces sp. BC1015]
MSSSQFLLKLNPVQLQAVKSEARSLQILAGPGSGKTRVLTSRVAWLVLEKKVNPSRIVVVTFTNKAAKEMKERLQGPDLLGQQTSNKLVMGTFHSICSRFLRRHSAEAGLENNFIIADTDMSEISKSKNEGLDCDAYVAKHRNDRLKEDYILVFQAYEERLESENMVDFDNLLLRNRDLLQRYPEFTEFIGNVLVDEFQDTNTVQYELVKLFANGGKQLSIVGDPDQSIFGWRSADVLNFAKMKHDFKDTVTVNLEENYRSTGSILTSALHVVNQDQTRAQKQLFTQNPIGVPISLLKMKDETLEAQTVADEITRIIKYSKGLITYKDIAILVRMNFMSRNLEQALTSNRIPHVVVGGVRFLERAEVKDILSYLSFFYNPKNASSFERVVNVPKRGIGEVSLNRILDLCRVKSWNIISVLSFVTASNTGPRVPEKINISKKAEQGLRQMLAMYREFCQMTNRNEPVSVILKYIVDTIGYEQYLKEHYRTDHESRWANVGELISFATTFKSLKAENDASINDIDPIGEFLEASTLSADQKEHDEASEGKVSIMTLHTAKGLEWPCVFIVGCEESIIPHTKAQVAEERSHKSEIFLANIPAEKYQNQTPSWDNTVREWVARVLGSTAPEEDTKLEHKGDKVWADEYDGRKGHTHYVLYSSSLMTNPYGHYSTAYTPPPQKIKPTKTTAPMPVSNLPGFSSASNLLLSQPAITSTNFADIQGSSVPAPSVSKRKAMNRNTNTPAVKKKAVSPSSTVRDVIISACKPEMLQALNEKLILPPRNKKKANDARSSQTMAPTSLNQCITNAIKTVGNGAVPFTLQETRSAVEQEIRSQNINVSGDIVASETQRELDSLVDQGALAFIRTRGIEKYAVVL